MANTSLSLGEHWEVFIRKEVGSGRYGSASEVVRDALRALEEQKMRLDTLRLHLAQGAAQARNGDFVEDYSADRIIAALDEE
ncbi:type II toxin-antitoxin system ParD family antitoxin [Sphingomonas sp. ZT3P38]|uniref:type II toxin-antitoxin system ParD family antitoxin n=1 Tax=Parasphingomonas zepuensis TaxID=3096161 RepID=UPI002FC78006